MRAEPASRFSFFALVELLERHHRPKARVGYTGPPSEEIVLFSADPSLAFPVSEVVKLEGKLAEETGPPGSLRPPFRVTVALLGLLGVVSPIPLFYTEDIIQNDPDENLQRAFLDLFHHRSLSLLYRAWLKYQYPFQMLPDASDAVSRRLLSVMGFGTAESVRHLPLLPAQLLRYAGLFYSKPRSASALRTILRDLTGVSISIEQCIGWWSRLPAFQRSALGRCNSSLRDSVALGTRMRSFVAAFRIKIGPVSFDAMKQYLPLGRRFNEITRIASLFLTDRLSFDVELLIEARTIRPATLASADEPRLGWTTFLGTLPAPKREPPGGWIRAVALAAARKGQAE